MATKRLIAVRDFTFTTLAHRTRNLTAGEEFEAEPIEAAALVYQHKAKFASSSAGEATPQPTARQAAIPEDPPRRRYRRRDLRAED